MTAFLCAAPRALRSSVVATLLIAAAPSALAAIEITLTPFASGFSAPLSVVNAGDSRLFVVEKGGHIKVVLSNGTVLGTDFLDLDMLVSMGGEQGLLGLAFHPDYFSNGFFYVNYTDLAGDTQIVRYTVSGDPVTSNVADPMSATPVLTVDQPFANHNAGDLKFGPDGYLYIPLGDGGLSCDPGDRSQDPAELLGKVLRIDVDSGSPYAIPPTNPFAGSMTVEEEIWAFGLRNPFRFSFDRVTGDMYIADVGQNRIEEVNVQAAASTGGENYGWDCFEGNDSSSLAPSNCTTTATCMPSTMFDFPVHQYDHSGGRCSVTGGFVYRGSLSPTLVGHYFFADFCSSDIYSLATPGYALTAHGQVVGGLNPAGFGEDSVGALYVAGFNGTVYRIDEVLPCPTEPATSCTATSKGALTLKRPDDPAKRKLIWKWQNGPVLAQGDFGDPVIGGTDYTLCIYAGTGGAEISATIEAGAEWKVISTKGYKFKDTSATPEGITKTLLKGGDAGKSKLLVKGKGANLDLAALPLDGSSQVLVQLVRDDDPACWEAVFPAASIDTNDATQFKAKIP